MFSLAVPAFAESEIVEEPVCTEGPVATEEPAAEPPEEPVEPEVPEGPEAEATEAPVVTEVPAEEVPAEPVVTEAPAEEVPEEPVVTEVPEEPAAIEAPVEITEAPEATAAPEVAAPPEEPVTAAEEPGVIDSGTCGAQGDNLTWKITGTPFFDLTQGPPDTSDWVLTISGTGDMANYNSNIYDQPWAEYMVWAGDVLFQTLIIGEGVTSIGINAFYGQRAGGLYSVTLPSTLKVIGSCAFFNSITLTGIRIPEGVTNIGNWAFGSCASLTNMTIPASVTHIGWDAFSDCSSLASVTVLNPACIIEDTDTGEYAGTTLGVPGTTVICGYAGSTAQAYAEQYGYKFEPLDKAPTAKPAQPKVSKVTNTAEGVTITWNAVEGAETYTVYSKTDSGKWKKLADTAETSYTWTKAKSGTKYSFSVSATNALGSSKYNKTGKSITYMAQPKVKSAKIDASGVKITWAKVNGAAKYQVMYKTGDGKWKVLAKSVMGTSYTWTKAKSGTSYTFSVRAVAKDGSNSAYNETGKSLTYIAAPKVKDVKKVSGGIKITWAKVNGAATYQVMYKIGNGKWKALTTTDKRTFTWKKAKNGTTYMFSVRAVAADGTKGVYNTTGKSLTYKK